MRINFVRPLAILPVIFLISCVTPPKVTPCSLVNVDTAECRPVDADFFDKNTAEMLGYTCFSPEDIGELKKYLRKLLSEFEVRSEFVEQYLEVSHAKQTE